jgi:hypothetical protein
LAVAKSYQKYEKKASFFFVFFRGQIERRLAERSQAPLGSVAVDLRPGCAALLRGFAFYGGLAESRSFAASLSIAAWQSRFLWPLRGAADEAVPRASGVKRK